MARSWIDAEPGWRDARRELRSIRRRARVRWLRTVLYALLATSLIVAYRARKQRLFPASIVIRVVEGPLDPTTAPPTANKLVEHLNDVALSRHVLLDVIEEHGLYRSEMRIDPNLALEVMREDLDLRVVANYFSQQRFSEDPARSARVVITYSGRQPDRALEVVRHLGRIVAAEQTEARQQVAAVAAATAADAAAELRQRLSAARAEQAALQLRVGESLPEQAARDVVRLRNVTADIRDLERQLAQASASDVQLGLRQRLEASAMGLRFEVVDNGRIPEVMLSKTAQLGLLAVIALLFLLPVVGIGVGAFDARVYDADNLRRLGIEPFGHIPAFPGHGGASLAARQKALRTP